MCDGLQSFVHRAFRMLPNFHCPTITPFVRWIFRETWPDWKHIKSTNTCKVMHTNQKHLSSSVHENSTSILQNQYSQSCQSCQGWRRWACDELGGLGCSQWRSETCVSFSYAKGKTKDVRWVIICQGNKHLFFYEQSRISLEFCDSQHCRRHQMFFFVVTSCPSGPLPPVPLAPAPRR